MHVSTLTLEDHSGWAVMVERVLTDADIRVTHTSADSEAKTHILTTAQLSASLDLVISDINHPEVGGVEFLRWLRQLSGDVVVKGGLRACKLPVVFLSASGAVSVIRDAFRLGASDMIDKASFQPAEFLRSIDHALTSYRCAVLAEFQDLGMAVTYEGGRYALTEAYVSDERLIETSYAIGRSSNLGGVPRKLILASDRLGAGERAVEEFEWLLNKQETSETDLHRFFVRNPEFLLGSEFAWFWSEPRLKHAATGRIVRPDFVLQPHDATLPWTWAAVDLKSPHAPLLRRSSFHTDFTINVHRVVTQLKDYAEFFEDLTNADVLRRRFGGHIPKPRLVAIIGRLPDDRERFAALKRRLPDVYLATYDEVLESRRAQLRRLRELAGDRS